LSIGNDKVDHPYPYFGLRECGHREIRHNPPECGEVLESLMYSTLGQATSDYGGARFHIVHHLGEPSGVDMNSHG